MLRIAYDSEGRKYFVEEPLMQPRGPVETTDSDGNLSFTSGFNQGVRQANGIGGRWRGDGGSYITGYLTGILLFLVAVVLGRPVFRWSKYVWTPILGRRNCQTGTLWNLVKGLTSVVAWVPFYGLVIGLAASLASILAPGILAWAPIASSVVVCSLMGAGLQVMTGNAHQTPAALAAQIEYTERYSGSLLYQGLALVALMARPSPFGTANGVAT